MAHGTPTVIEATLVLRGDEQSQSLAVGSAAWFDWLETANSFAFTGPDGTFTASKVRFQRGGWYWTAHRRQSGVLRNAYLGKSGALTIERLNEVAAKLAAPEFGGGTAMTGTPRPRKTAKGTVPATGQDASSKPETSTRLLGTTDQAILLLKTKIMPPVARDDLLPRPHLIERLSRVMQHKLTLVSAPAGFGKTTLLRVCDFFGPVPPTAETCLFSRQYGIVCVLAIGS